MNPACCADWFAALGAGLENELGAEFQHASQVSGADLDHVEAAGVVSELRVVGSRLLTRSWDSGLGIAGQVSVRMAANAVADAGVVAVAGAFMHGDGRSGCE
jgi:hypothetical protein